MELREYWASLGRKRWALVAVPVIAGAVAGGIGLQQPTDYKATTTTQVPTGAVGPILNRQAMANFQSLVTSVGVEHDVAVRTGVSTSDLSKQLTATQVGLGDVAEITFTGANSRQAADVTSTAARVAIDRFSAPQVATAAGSISTAEKQLADARANYDQARSALDAFVRNAPQPTPAQAYSQAVATYARLHSQLRAAALLGNATSVQRRAVARARAAMRTLAPQAQRYNDRLQSLTQAKGQAGVLLLSAKQAVARAKVTQVSVTPSAANLLSTTVTTRTPRTTSLIQLIAGSAILAFIVVAIGFVCVSLLRTGSGRERRTTRAGSPVSPPAPAVGVAAELPSPAATGTAGEPAELSVREHGVESSVPAEVGTVRETAGEPQPADAGVPTPSSTEATVQPDPVQPDPVQPDPVQPDKVQPEPVQPEPVQPEPVHAGDPIPADSPLPPDATPVDPEQDDPTHGSSPEPLSTVAPAEELRPEPDADPYPGDHPPQPAPVPALLPSFSFARLATGGMESGTTPVPPVDASAQPEQDEPGVGEVGAVDEHPGRQPGGQGAGGRVDENQTAAERPAVDTADGVIGTGGVTEPAQTHESAVSGSDVGSPRRTEFETVTSVTTDEE
jgi:hypothetical protein